MKIAFTIFCFLLTVMVANGQSKQQAVKHAGQMTPHFDPEKATSELLNTIPASTRDKANNYSEGGHWLILWNFAYAMLIAWIFLFGGLLARLNKFSYKTSNRNWNNLIYIAIYFLVSFLLSLPLNIYQNFIREKQYGLSSLNFMQWFSKDLMTFLIELIIAAPFFVLVYATIKKAKGNWWVWGAGIAIITFVVIVFTYPAFISPVFNEMAHHTPGHFFILILEFGLLILTCFKLIKWALNKLLLTYGERWKVRDIRDVTSLPLLIFLFTSCLFIITPIKNTIIRVSEIEADIYELNAARDPDAFATMQIKSSEFNKIDPGYWEEIFFFDHPSGKKRILNAMKWKAENIILLPFFDIRRLGC